MPKPKYRTPEYRAARRNLADRMRRDGYLICVEPRCLHHNRIIRPGQKWHVCHDETGTRILGPGHERCNTSEGATRGNAARGRPKRWNL